MKNLKVGDKVKVFIPDEWLKELIESETVSLHLTETVGKIIHVNEKLRQYEIAFEGWNDGHSGSAENLDCTNRWYVNEELVILIPPEFTKKMMIEALRRAVEERGPDYVYERPFDPARQDTLCLYRDPITDEPSCLIGLAISYIYPDLRLKEYTGVSGSFTDIENIEGGAMLIASYAQSVQDSGGTWGEALKAAEAVYAEIKEKE